MKGVLERKNSSKVVEGLTVWSSNLTPLTAKIKLLLLDSTSAISDAHQCSELRFQTFPMYIIDKSKINTWVPQKTFSSYIHICFFFFVFGIMWLKRLNRTFFFLFLFLILFFSSGIASSTFFSDPRQTLFNIPLITTVSKLYH